MTPTSSLAYRAASTLVLPSTRSGVAVLPVAFQATVRAGCNPRASSGPNREIDNDAFYMSAACRALLPIVPNVRP